MVRGLIREALPLQASVYYVGDDREGALQRAALAREIARLVPGLRPSGVAVLTPADVLRVLR